jgi:hypothetical protein
MSSAKPPQGKEPATLQSTRQMLDELDALMDRMLAIPVNELDDPPTAPRGIVRMPTVSATLTVLDATMEDEDVPAKEEPLPLRQSFPSYRADLASTSQETKPLPLLIEPPPFRPSQKAIEPEPDPIPEEVIPPSISAITALSVPAFNSDTAEAPPSLPEVSLASRCLLPLLWFNQGFDKCTFLLGGVGRWLRGTRGRYFLGLAGLALLAAAGLWLVKDWLGWTW